MCVNLEDLSRKLIEQHDRLWYSNQSVPGEYVGKDEYVIKEKQVNVSVQMVCKIEYPDSSNSKRIPRQVTVVLKPYNEEVAKVISSLFLDLTWDREKNEKMFNSILINDKELAFL